MILERIAKSPDGSTWIRVGYSSPRIKSGAVYRYVRTSDGARIRIPSTKFYACAVSQRNWANWTDVPTGHDESVRGSGAMSLETDRARMKEVLREQTAK